MGKYNAPSPPCVHRSDPLPPISRIEARSYSHLLRVDASSSSSSSPGAATTTPVSTPSTAIRRRRRSQPRPPPRPLRALALRRALARALDETLAVLERATADLNALLPRDSPLLDLVPPKPKPPSAARSPLLPVDSWDSEDPESEERELTEENDAGAEGGGSDEIEAGRRRRRRKTRQSAGGASIAELLRHDERARRERDELDKFNSNNNESSRSHAGEEEVEEEEGDLSAAAAAAVHQRTSSSSTTTTMPMSDPYHPTENTFGGIERRRHVSLNSPAAAVRLRDSLTLSMSLSSASSPLRRSSQRPHQQQRHSLSPPRRRHMDGPSSSLSLEEEIIAAAAREAGQGEEGGAAETTSSRMMMMTPSRGAPPRFSITSEGATPPSSDSWRSASRCRSRRRPVSLGGVSAPASASLRRVLSVQQHSSGSRSTRGADEVGAAAAAAAESSSPSSSSSSSPSSPKSRRSGSPPPLGRPLSATSSSPSPDPVRLPPATEPDSATTTVIPLLLVSLQDTFDDLHALRRGVIWRLLEALSGAESDRNWNALAGVVGGGLAERLEEIAKDVGEVQERELFDGAVGGGGGGGLDAADVRAKEMEMERRKEKEKRRRSGAYARELFDDDADGPDVLDLGDEVEVEENVFSDAAGRTGELDTASRRDALARLTGTPTPTPIPPPPPPLSSSLLNTNKTKQNRRAPPASYANFAPPSSTSVAFSSSDSAADPDLVGHARLMALALRAIEAKLRLVVDEVVAHSSPAGDDHDHDHDEDGRRRRLLAVGEMYRGIGVELKRLEEQWRVGGDVLDRAMGLVVRATPPALAEDAEAEPSVAVRDLDGSTGQEKDEEGRNQLGAEDAVLQTEPSGGTGDEDDDDDDPIANRQALVDAALSASLLIPPSAPAEEKVFEAVAGPVRSTSSDGSNKFSREERIRRMKEAREALARGRESLESSPAKSRTGSAPADADAGSPLGSRSGGGASSSLAQQQKMVGELQEVLREYNRERGRNVSGGPDIAAAASTPLTPTKTTTTALPPPLALPPLPPPVPFPVASSPPPRATFALPPPPPPPAHRQPVTFASTSTSPQKALPQTPPRNAISPVSGLRGRPTPPLVQQSPLGQQQGTPSSASGKRYSVQSV